MRKLCSRLLAVAVAALLASPAAADVLTVTDGGDDPVNPQPGTLRHVLTREAKAGDTIRFAQPLAVTLSDRRAFLDVPKDLTGLRIEGPVTIRRAGGAPGTLRIFASGVVVRDVDFISCNVDVDGNTSIGRGGGEVRDVRIEACDFSGRSLVTLTLADACVVDGNTFDVDLRSQLSGVVHGLFVTGCRFANNTVTVRGPAGDLVADQADDCTIEGNTLTNCGIFALEFQGTVAGNRTPGGTITIDKRRPDGSGAVTEVRDNVAAAIAVRTVNATVTGNRVGLDLPPGSTTKPPQFALAVSGDHFSGAAHTGPLLVQQNQVRGGKLGSLFVVGRAATTSVTVSDNTITAPGRFAMVVNTETTTAVLRNTITSDRATGREGIRIVRAPSGGTRVEGNTVTDVPGDAIVVFPGQRALLRANTVAGCGRNGVLTGDGARLEIDGGTVQGSARHGVYLSDRTVATIRGATIQGNGLAGVFADGRAVAEIARNVLSGNAGPGIDLAPAGVTPNSKRKTANGNVPFPVNLTFDDATGRVTGKAEPGARIDAYAVEEGDRKGNPANGEGVSWLGEVFADANGDFTFPSGGRAPCPPSKKICFTATRVPSGTVVLNPKIVTSEFSADVECRAGATVELVSKATDGSLPDQRADTTAQSGLRQYTAGRFVADAGRYVVFVSQATNLDPGPHTERNQYVFLRDTTLGTTTRVSRTHHGGAFRRPSGLSVTYAGDQPSISEDGRWTAFATTSDEVVAGDDDGGSTVVLFDRDSGQTTAVTDPVLKSQAFPDGRYIHLGGHSPAISGDGSAVAFVSLDGNWTGGDTGDDEDVFVWTRASGAFERISVPSGGGDLPGVASAPRISHDGRWVVFASSQALAAGTSGFGPFVYLRDRQAGTTVLVSTDEGGTARPGAEPCVSDDGRYVAYETSSAIVASDTDGRSDVYVLDRQTNTRRRVSLRADSTPFPAACFGPSMSGNGRRIAFMTTGGHSSPDGPTVLNLREVWVADLDASSVEEAAVGPTADANGITHAPGLSRDGLAVAFTSAATNLVPEATTSLARVYLRRFSASQ